MANCLNTSKSLTLLSYHLARADSIASSTDSGCQRTISRDFPLKIIRGKEDGEKKE